MTLEKMPLVTEIAGLPAEIVLLSRRAQTRSTNQTKAEELPAVSLGNKDDKSFKQFQTTKDARLHYHTQRLRRVLQMITSLTIVWFFVNSPILKMWAASLLIP